MNFNLYSKEEYFFDPLQEAILETTYEEIKEKLKDNHNRWRSTINCSELLYNFLKAYHLYEFSIVLDTKLKFDEYKINMRL